MYFIGEIGECAHERTLRLLCIRNVRENFQKRSSMSYSLQEAPHENRKASRASKQHSLFFLCMFFEPECITADNTAERSNHKSMDCCSNRRRQCWFNYTFATIASSIRRKYKTRYPTVVLAAKKHGRLETVRCGRPYFYPRLSKDKSNRIAGGWEVKAFSLPWMVSLQLRFDKRLIHVCGGSVISLKSGNATDLVLSAAHCVIRSDKAIPPDRMVVVAGTHDFMLTESNTRQIIPVKSYIDASYIVRSARNDLLLVNLVSNLRLSEYVQPICLPRKPNALAVGTVCFVAGWGRMTELGETEYPSKLLMADVAIENIQNCKKHYGLAISKRFQICAMSKLHRGTCMGDSGGPLMCRKFKRFVLYGITSYGKNCSLKDVPSVYTKVSSYVAWVRNFSM
uniref:Peptidase S1 domain-containing protein n=1 Tax=Trichuris muris TaxID=70415 RepID=A0A5S6QPY2_TRIMR